jgi:hypothetical protein
MSKKALIPIGIIAITVIIFLVMAAQHNKTLANVDQKAKEVDAAAAHLIDVCNHETNPQALGMCDANIQNLYNNECINDMAILSVCASNGPVEQYLKKTGYL